MAPSSGRKGESTLRVFASRMPMSAVEVERDSVGAIEPALNQGNRTVFDSREALAESSREFATRCVEATFLLIGDVKIQQVSVSSICLLSR